MAYFKTRKLGVGMTKMNHLSNADYVQVSGLEQHPGKTIIIVQRKLRDLRSHSSGESPLMTSLQLRISQLPGAHG